MNNQFRSKEEIQKEIKNSLEKIKTLSKWELWNRYFVFTIDDLKKYYEYDGTFICDAINFQNKFRVLSVTHEGVKVLYYKLGVIPIEEFIVFSRIEFVCKHPYQLKYMEL